MSRTLFGNSRWALQFSRLFCPDLHRFCHGAAVQRENGTLGQRLRAENAMTCRRPSHRRADVWPEAHSKDFIRISSSIDWKTKRHGLSPENNNKRFTASADKKVYEGVANAKKENAAPPTLKLSNWKAASIQTSRILQPKHGFRKSKSSDP